MPTTFGRAKRWFKNLRNKKKNVSPKHIISTHVEDVSMDFVGNTPRGAAGSPADSAMDLDSNVLTRILDANDKVQSALKGWREVEKQLNQKWADDMVQDKRDESAYSSSAKPHSCVRRHTTSKNSIPRSSSSIVDAIDQQLHAAQVMQIMRAEGQQDHLDSMSSDVTQTGPSFTTPTESHNGMWVDFSDSSGSQLSRPTPLGPHSAHPSPFQMSPGQPLLDTRGSGLSMKSVSPTKEFGRRDFRGSSSPETPNQFQGGSGVQGVPGLNLQTPFSTGEPTAFVGTPRPTLVISSVHQVPLGPAPITTRKSGQRELRQSNSFPRERSISKDSPKPEPQPQTEEENSDFYSCASRLTDLSATSSFLASRYSQLATTRSASSSSGEECEGSAGKASTSSSIQPFRHQYSRSTLPESEFHRKQHLDISRTDLTKTEFIRRVKSPTGGKNRTLSNRRIPPALRVRFTPEHLKDVLERVGKVRSRPRTVHPDVSTARL